MSRVLKATNLVVSSPKELFSIAMAEDIIQEGIKDHSPLEGEVEQLKREIGELLAQKADLQRDIALVIEEVEAEGKRILLKAEEQAAAIRSQAEQAGYQQGYQAGLAKAREESQNLLRQAEQVLTAAIAAKSQVIRQSENEIIALIIAVAEKVTMTEIKTNPQVITEVVRTAIAETGVNGRLRVKVNPADYPVLLETIGDLASDFKEARIDLVDDPGISPGGCIIETGHGWLDARIESRWEDCRKALLDGETE